MENNIKDQALDKMLNEMNEKHSPAVDQIHNWICDQEDEDLMANILKPGKTIAGAFEYAKNNARKEAQNGVACIEDVQVFDWVKEYFASDKVEEPAKEMKHPVVQKYAMPSQTTKEIEIAAKEKAAIAVQNAARKLAHVPDTQTSIFDFGA